MTGRLRRLAAAAAFATGAGALAAPPAPGTSGPLLARDSREAAVFRGTLVFSTYCVTCHGVLGDGNGRAARLYDPKPANLRASDKNDAYVKLMVVRGGAALGRSEFMPAWSEELTDEQIADVVAFLRSINVNP
ncbi:MAG TPA: cytochrome c [Albitalea sp.]